MSNPEFTAPDFTSQDAATYKANIDASIAANGADVINIGFSYASGTGTFTVHDAQGNALSASNPGFVRVQDKDNPGYNKYVSIEANQTFVDDNGSSEIINNLFGVTTGTASTTDVKFYIYAVVNDDMDSIQFMLSRAPNRIESPASTDIGAPDDAVADSFISFWSIDSLDETQYDENPCIEVGAFRMRMSTSDDWTVQTLDIAKDGVQTKHSNNPSFFAMLSASAENITGSGTVATIPFDTVVVDTTGSFDNTTYKYTIPETGLYLINTMLEIIGITDQEYYYAFLDSGGQLMKGNPLNEDPDSGYVGGITRNGSQLVYYPTGTTVRVRLQLGGGSAVSGVKYTSTFSGTLIARL